MPYKTSWIIKYRLILQQITGELDPSDISNLTATLADFIEEAQAQGYTNLPAIFDMREMEGELPEQTFTSIEMEEFISTLDPRLLNIKRGFLILITPNKKVSSYVSIINQIFAQPMTTVQTMEEALDIIRSMYPKLSKLLEDENNTN